MVFGGNGGASALEGREEQRLGGYEGLSCQRREVGRMVWERREGRRPKR